MLTASRSIAAAAAKGGQLPYVDGLEALYTYGTTPRRGQICMVAGQPGSQKSGFALWYTTRLGLDTLYFSADSDAHTVSSRLAAIHTGRKVREVEDDFEDEDGRAYYSDVLAQQSKIRLCYESNPTLDTMQEELDAWVEMFDEYPAVIVVDNLMDLVFDGENEFAGQKQLLLSLKSLGRVTGAAIVVLHHMTEAVGEADKPSPRKAVQGKVAQTPEVILSVAVDGNVFHIATVKDRSGPADPSGKTYVTLGIDPSRNHFERYTTMQQRADEIGHAMAHRGEWSPSGWAA